VHFPQVAAIDTQGLNGDMLEAQAFAYLAARVQAGLPTSSPQTSGVPRATIGGQVARP
jgi:anhydro-N-acetylmuramic acid kinase